MNINSQKIHLNLNKNNYIFKQINIKQIIIKFIYDHVNFNVINSFKYHSVKDVNLTLFKDNNFVLQPYINGLDCLCVIIKHRTNYYSCLVEKQNLKPNIDDIVINDVDMFYFNTNFSNSRVYNGTILDGIYKYNILDNKNDDTANKEEFFIVNDIYMLMGKQLIDNNLQNKIINFKSFSNHFSNNNFNIYLNNYLFLNSLITDNNILDRKYIINYLINTELNNNKTKINISNIVNGIRLLYYKDGNIFIFNRILNNSNQLLKSNKTKTENFIYKNQKVKEEKILTFLCIDCKKMYLRHPTKYDFNEKK